MIGLDPRSFIGVKLTQKNQILKNGFVCIHYRLCKISAKIIDFKFFVNYELSATTIYSVATPTPCRQHLLPPSTYPDRSLHAGNTYFSPEYTWFTHRMPVIHLLPPLIYVHHSPHAGSTYCPPLIIIIIINKRGWQCKAGRERLTSYQSVDPNPTTPTHRKKE